MYSNDSLSHIEWYQVAVDKICNADIKFALGSLVWFICVDKSVPHSCLLLLFWCCYWYNTCWRSMGNKRRSPELLLFPNTSLTDWWQTRNSRASHKLPLLDLQCYTEWLSIHFSLISCSTFLFSSPPTWEERGSSYWLAYTPGMIAGQGQIWYPCNFKTWFKAFVALFPLKTSSTGHFSHSLKVFCHNPIWNWEEEAMLECHHCQHHWWWWL